jgi:hypothetical protein
MAEEKPTVGRDGSVHLDGALLGWTWGQPRDWWYRLADGLTEPVPHQHYPQGGHHSRREAADACTRAYRASQKQQSADIKEDR